MKEKITILIPVYNDNESVNQLLKDVASVFANATDFDFSVLIINDGSTDQLTIQAGGFEIQVLNLQRNIGHQKAIAVGLAYIKDKISCNKVLVMDGDGQDSAADALRLIQASTNNTGQIIFAARKSRKDSGRFQFFYSLYKLLFRILTGRKISFGNFLIMPRTALDKIVFYSEIWNHVSGGIIKSGLSYTSIEADRGKRYFDSSKMNFNSLVLHGLGAISVFLDVIAIRLLIFSFAMIVISLITILTTFVIRAFTDLAIPGWASTVVSSFVIILLQSFLLSLFTIFLYLTSQSQRKFIPAYHYNDYTGTIEKISPTL